MEQDIINIPDSLRNTFQQIKINCTYWYMLLIGAGVVTLTAILFQFHFAQEEMCFA